MTKLTCPGCRQELSERQLVSMVQEVGHCPKCNDVVQTNEGFRYSDEDAQTMGDVSAIDAWLETYSASSGVIVKKRQTTKSEVIWDVDTSPYRAELEYKTDRHGVLSVRLVSDQHGEKVFADPDRLSEVCAGHGLQPFGKRNTNVLGGKVECVWGATQYVSTHSLSASLLTAVLERINHAIDSAETDLGL